MRLSPAYLGLKDFPAYEQRQGPLRAAVSGLRVAEAEPWQGGSD